MKYKSVFDIIGPIMIGPSSSHTAGVVKIGKLSRMLFGGDPKKANIYFYGSFAQTYKGHATDVAIVGGLLGFEPNDKRIRNSLEYAEKNGVEINFFSDNHEQQHPNTLMMELFDDKKTMRITGVSLGGGTVAITRINNFSIHISGELPALLVMHNDVYGVMASVLNKIAAHSINVAYMTTSRSDKGGEALMVIESDEKIDNDVVEAISKLDNIIWVKTLSM